MSRSETYRPALLSAACRNELVELARRDRTRRDVLPVLQRRLERTSARLDAQQGTSPQRSRLVAQAAVARSVGDLRRLAVDLARTGLPGGAPPPATVAVGSRTTTPRRTQADVARASDRSPRATGRAALAGDLAGLDFDAAQAEAELDSLVRTAAGLGTTLDDDHVARARSALAAARDHLSRADTGVARAHLATAGATVAALDEEVEEALVRAETHARVVGAIETALGGDMQVSVTTVGSTTTITGRAVDGVEAAVEVATGADATSDCTFVFTDPGDALPQGAEGCEAICDPAVSRAVVVHASLAAESDIAVGDVTTAHRPTRSSGAGHPVHIPIQPAETRRLTR